MSKFTLGPWTACMSSQSFWYVDGPDNTGYVAITSGTENAEANARLIAAAPSLLEALTAFAFATRNNPHLVRQYNAAMAAIAKAEGK